MKIDQLRNEASKLLAAGRQEEFLALIEPLGDTELASLFGDAVEVGYSYDDYKDWRAMKQEMADLKNRFHHQERLLETRINEVLTLSLIHI